MTTFARSDQWLHAKYRRALRDGYGRGHLWAFQVAKNVDYFEPKPHPATVAHRGEFRSIAERVLAGEIRRGGTVCGCIGTEAKVPYPDVALMPTFKSDHDRCPTGRHLIVSNRSGLGRGSPGVTPPPGSFHGGCECEQPAGAAS